MESISTKQNYGIDKPAILQYTINSLLLIHAQQFHPSNNRDLETTCNVWHRNQVAARIKSAIMR